MEYKEPHYLENQFYWDIDDAKNALIQSALDARLDKKEAALANLKKAIFSAQQALEKLEK